MSAHSSDTPVSVPEFVPVVIVGAGPAGITAATLLAQYGIEWCWTAMKPPTRCRGRCTPTTRSTAS